MPSLSLDTRAHDEAKRLLGQSAPHIKSSHRAEALARGLGFGSNAALQAALSAGAIPVRARHEPFEAFLAERGYDLEGLQVSLVTDAVALACGGSPGAGVHFAPGGFPIQRIRPCMSCIEDFGSEGRNNLICHVCKLREGRVAGVQHAPRVLPEHFGALMERGKPPSLEYLRVRPGWSDVLDGADFVDKSGRAVRIKRILDEGDRKALTDEDRAFVHRYGSLALRGEIAPPPGFYGRG